MGGTPLEAARLRPRLVRPLNRPRAPPLSFAALPAPRAAPRGLGRGRRGVGACVALWMALWCDLWKLAQLPLIGGRARPGDPLPRARRRFSQATLVGAFPRTGDATTRLQSGLFARTCLAGRPLCHPMVVGPTSSDRGTPLWARSTEPAGSPARGRPAREREREREGVTGGHYPSTSGYE